eukprot:TRINITY_DN299_c0_g2_i4.p1 TRINITY_DN299_c0_g2~~TRINITY_DN299_c0_g2_i4.p1  ORF type:complete len:498 (-),score=2.48 TRINITY_DN299_c0_g2_i4:243-1580(-)
MAAASTPCEAPPPRSKASIAAAASTSVRCSLLASLLLLLAAFPASVRCSKNNDWRPDDCVDSSLMKCDDKCNAATPGLKSNFTFPSVVKQDKNGVYQCPAGYDTPSTTRIRCYSIKSEPTCCNDCNNRRTCQFWQFWQQGNTCPASSGGCGICIHYPPTVPGPKCSNSIVQENITRVSRPCPSTQNDPHFTGAHGTRYEFNGLPDKSFCLLTDRSIQVNMRMRGYYDTRTTGASIMKDGKAVRTWIRELGIVWTSPAEPTRQHTLRLVARDGKSSERGGDGYLGAIEFDGRELPLLKLGSGYVLPGGLNFTFTAYEKQGGGFFDVDVYSLEIAGLIKLDVKLRVAHPLLQTSDDAQAHINLHFLDVQRTEDVHGVLGQTYRAGRSKRALEYSALSALLKRAFAADGEEGKGFLDGTAEDYRTSGVLSTDCTYTTYGGRSLPPTQE